MKRIALALALIVTLFAAPPFAEAKPAPAAAAITSGWAILQGEVVEVTPGPVYSVTIETANGNQFTFRLDETMYNWFSSRLGQTVKVWDRLANNDPGPPPVNWLVAETLFTQGDYAEDV